ncbi:Protein of unknown function [Leuconostoc citreum LBAE E16]|nr:Protein of unknown function [Leuconostoc citreum LBAE E16]
MFKTDKSDDFLFRGYRFYAMIMSTSTRK